MDLRVGHGLDVHRLEANRKLVLGGVHIPFDRGLAGHSDADVVCHALIDALLGAAGLGDIGQRFPNTDPRFKDANSLELLKIVWTDVHGIGWKISNADICVFAEAPKIAPYAEAIKANLGEVLGVGPELIGLKAGTMEQLGALGRGEGIAASAVVLLMR